MPSRMVFTPSIEVRGMRSMFFACEVVGFFHFVAVLRAGPFLDDFDAEFFVFQIGFHAFEKAAHEPFRRIALAVDEALARHHGAGDVGLADLGHVEKLGEAEILRANITRYRDRRRVDNAVDQALHQQAHLIELHDRDIGIRIQVPHFQHRARERIGCRADARDADPFAFQIRRRLDL